MAQNVAAAAELPDSSQVCLTLLLNSNNIRHCLPIYDFHTFVYYL